MNKLKFLMIFILSLSLVIFISCGGKSKKINEVAEEEQNVLDEEAEAKKAELPTTYLVEKGDELWTIAEKAEIYGNKWQWPLIYDANRDILDSYTGLKEGQKLIIPRNVSAVEIEAAKERAMELGIPPVEKSVKVKGEEEEIAGLTEETEKTRETSTSSEDLSSEEQSGTQLEEETEPTPIPEIPGKTSKGGINITGIIIGLLLVVAIIVLFLFYQKKKKEEEEEENKTDDTSSGSGGILT